jgi:hypothetical protein
MVRHAMPFLDPLITRSRSLLRIVRNSGLPLAVLLFALVLAPNPGWAHETKNCPTEPAQNVPVVSGETITGPIAFCIGSAMWTRSCSTARRGISIGWSQPLRPAAIQTTFV